MLSNRPKIVVLGMVTKIPVAGVVWQTLHYLLGFDRLGFEPYYVEAHARTPSMLMRTQEDDGAGAAASFIERFMRRFGMANQWAYQALHDDGRCYGLSEHQLNRLYEEADLIINLHGGTAPRSEHVSSGRLVYVETDPVQLQLELAAGDKRTIEFLEQHCAFFTFGENWGNPDCGLEPTERFPFHPTRQPICLDLWPPAEQGRASFTTIGNWRQDWRDVTVGSRVYTWSKHVEFERVLALPLRTDMEFELALSQLTQNDREKLERHGWRVRDAGRFTQDVVRYRSYISGSLGEFTVAKEQNVKLRSGWFSDRSATYLAAGRPVITQETGFSNTLPTGRGLHSFSTIDEAVGAIEAVCGNYRRERGEARLLAREHFASERVLGHLLERVGVTVPGRSRASGSVLLGPDLDLTPVSRRPLKLMDQTLQWLRDCPWPTGSREPALTPIVSIVVVSHDDVGLTRLCLEAVLANTHLPAFELVVVDNASSDGSRAYLRTLERRFDNVHLLLNDENRGFPAACNQGLEVARGEVFVLLNSDTIVPPGWLSPLVDAVGDDSVALAGPVTNRIGNEAEVRTDYRTYGEFVECARARADAYTNESFEIPMPAMFCLALRREVFERIGRLDERFGLGTLEDDDYAERVAAVGLRSVCREDVLVHHFGEGSFGRLFEDGRHSELLERNREVFAEKWGKPWRPYTRRQDPEYEELRSAIRGIVESHVPQDASVLVVSRGDEDLVAFTDRQGAHFPQQDDGGYSGHHPACGADAVAELERLRGGGAEFLLIPSSSRWWLDHYGELAEHINARYPTVIDDKACVVFDLARTG